MSKLNSFFWWLDDPTEVVNSKPWVPSRPVTHFDPTANQITDLQAQVTDVAATVAVATTATTPLQILSCSAVESPKKQQGRTFSEVSVSYVVNPTDTNFAQARVWFTGYLGSTTPQLVTEGSPSPLTFLVETTGETVTVKVQAIGKDGTPADFAFCPTTTVLLDGVVSAPPAPSIASSPVKTPLGYTFSFNAEAGLLADVIDGYKVYRNTSNTTSGATSIQYIHQTPTNTGVIQVQDVTPINSTTYFYWVSAVNTSGLESTLTAAGSSTQDGYPQQVTGVSATESPYKGRAGQVVSLVSVNFTPAVGDLYFSSVEIWFTGYNGSSIPQLMAQSTTSPASFLTSTTNETVTVTVVAVSANGISASFAAAPTTTVLLDGVVSAPPAPSIAQSLISTPFGFQFSFNQLAAQSADIVDCYRVYRYTSNASGSAAVIQTIKHSATNSGVIVIQDQIEQYQTRWYWVSAVNTTGLESSLTAAQSGAVVSGAVAQGGSGDNLVYNGDLSIYTDPTGTTSSLENSSRVNDVGGDNICPNGWTRNFEAVSEGALARWNIGVGDAANAQHGSYVLQLLDNSGSTGAQFSAVTDAFPVDAGDVYYFSAWFWPGYGLGWPTHANWFFRIIWYKAGTTDFSVSSATKISSTDIVSGSTEHGAWVKKAKALLAPTNAGYCRMVFYRWNDGTATASAWCLQVADIKCTRITSSQQIPGVFNAGTFTATNILSNTAGSTIINVAANTIQFGFGQVAYNSGTVSPGSFGTWFVYAVDPGYNGGAVTYLATASFVTVNAQDWITYFGKIITASGGASGGGGSGGGGSSCFSGNVEIQTPSSLHRFDSLPRDESFFVNTLLGVRLARLIVHEDYSGDMIDMGDCKLVTPGHSMKCSDGWHPASEHFTGCPIVHFHGTVYNLHIFDINPEAHHYILASGAVAHNFFKA